MAPRLRYAQLSSDLTGKLSEMGQILKKDRLDRSLLHLVYLRASQLNHCAFCVDMHVKEAKIDGERELRLYHLSVWRESPLFTDRERATFEWTEAVTKLSGEGIPEDLFLRVRQHFSDQELSDLTCAIGIINMWNRLAVSFLTPPGSLDSLFGLEKAGLA